MGDVAATDLSASLRQGVAVRLQILAATMSMTWVAIMLINVLVVYGLGVKDLGAVGDHRSATAAMIIGWTMFGGVLLASGLLFWAARHSRATVERLSDYGLLYGIFATLLIAMAENQLPSPAGPIKGVSSSLGWIMFFPLLLHARPVRAVGAAFVAGACTPLAMFIWSGLGVPLPPAGAFFAWCTPVFISAGITAIPITVMHRMVLRVQEAHRTVEQLGSYHLEERIGEGGMGEVWRARHALLARPAAVKIIRSESLGDDPVAVETAMGRFEREAQATAELESPHSVILFDFGKTADGRIYYAMELLDGIDLETLVERHGPVPPARVVHILRQACDSLREAHERGLVHRDIKPANLMVCRFAGRFDFVKVLDFGLVKRHETFDGANINLTKTGSISGTPAFLAPEAITGENPVDGRTDLYALGCVAWWLLTGRYVFGGSTAMQIMLKHAKDEPDAAALHSEHELPEALKAIVLSCLAKDPEDRPGSAADLDDKLAKLELAEPWDGDRAHRWWDVHQPGDRT